MAEGENAGHRCFKRQLMSDKESTFLKVAQYQHQGNKILKFQESLLPERGDMRFLFFDTPFPSGAQRMTKTE